VFSVTLPTPLARFAPSRLPPYRPGGGNESTGFPESLKVSHAKEEKPYSRGRLFHMRTLETSSRAHLRSRLRAPLMLSLSPPKPQS
jgi:hypothetical protein